MLPLTDLHSQLDEALNINSSESNFSTLYYTDLINGQRSLWLRNEYNKNRTIDPNIQQSICDLELELVDPTCCDCVTLPISCKILRSIVPIPNTIEFYFTKGLTSVGPVDITKRRFTIIDYARVPYIGAGRTTQNTVYVFMYNNYVHVISASSLIINMKYINVRGLFEDPTKIGDFCDCANKPCWSPNEIYPINLWMWEYMKPIIVQGLQQKKINKLDDSNNGKDDTAEQK